MARITISDLYLSSDQSINELNEWEMKTVEGGVASRRRPSSSDTSGGTSDSSDTINTTLNSIDDLFSQLRVQIDETMYSLRTQLRNI